MPTSPVACPVPGIFVLDIVTRCNHGIVVVSALVTLIIAGAPYSGPTFTPMAGSAAASAAVMTWMFRWATWRF
jgi:hypothetical protein